MLRAATRGLGNMMAVFDFTLPPIIATTDTDFVRIPDVTIYTCNEKMLAA